MWYTDIHVGKHPYTESGKKSPRGKLFHLSVLMEHCAVSVPVREKHIPRVSYIRKRSAVCGNLGMNEMVQITQELSREE